jgi:hypothetical protein
MTEMGSTPEVLDEGQHGSNKGEHSEPKEQRPYRRCSRFSGELNMNGNDE